LAQDKIVPKRQRAFGDIQARHIGPALMSGRLPILKCIQQTTRSFTQVQLAAVYGKSNDGGASFNPIFDEHIQSIGCVAIDPSKPDQNIWVGTGETWTRNSVSMGDGIYKSTDGGQNWNMGLPKSDRIFYYR
jgi:hypothetical protein